jgi:N-acetylglutamate synthase-like GNAT family acetyltransferase
VTTRNQLTRRYDAAMLRSLRHEYLVAKDGRGTVQGGVAVRSLSSSVAEVRHLSVDSSVEGQGYGRRLLQAAEERAEQMGAQVLQATARADNQASRALLLQAGYTRTSTFRNDRSGNTIEVWHRPIGDTLPADISPPLPASAFPAQSDSWWQEQMARLLARGYREDDARRMLVGLLRRMGRPVPAGAA